MLFLSSIVFETPVDLGMLKLGGDWQQALVIVMKKNRPSYSVLHKKKESTSPAVRSISLTPSQLVGATTPNEYRKTIGKDAALEHRFQPVQIEEPAVESTISILRGLKPRYEVHHGLLSTVHDKAIDLVDEAAPSLRLAQESKPDELEALDRAIMTLQIKLESLKKESDTFSVERRSVVEAKIKGKRKEASKMYSLWQTERARLSRTKDLKQRLEDAKHQLDVAQREGDFENIRKNSFCQLILQVTPQDSGDMISALFDKLKV
ncbi:P-loop containing nucleoside triphosphate hydrolase protein [Mycena olivaceomarginata]|nr:P-loop containing nucleoside triphosphate hydrolase protein [Mycena olivaceomarginata]